MPDIYLESKLVHLDSMIKLRKLIKESKATLAENAGLLETAHHYTKSENDRRLTCA